MYKKENENIVNKKHATIPQISHLNLYNNSKPKVN